MKGVLLEFGIVCQHVFHAKHMHLGLRWSQLVSFLGLRWSQLISLSNYFLILQLSLTYLTTLVTR